MTALLDGEATQQAAKIAAKIDIPDTKFADPRLSGKAAVTATLSGSTAHPDASFELALTDARALDRSIPRLTFEGSARDLAGALDAELTLAGEIDRKPLAGATHIAKQANGGWLADKLDFTLGSVALRANAAVDTAGLANGRISVKAGDLDDISPLLLMQLAGDISLDASLDATDGKQNAKLNAHAAHLALSANRIEGLDADLTAADLFGRKTIDGTAVLAKAMLGSETVSALQLKAKSSAGGSDLDLTATARGLAVAAKARLMAEAQTRFDLSSFTARGAGHGVTLIAPARLAFGDAGVEITGLALGVDAGRLRLDGRAGARLDLEGQATGIPLAAAELAAPGLGLTGDAGRAIRHLRHARCPCGGLASQDRGPHGTANPEFRPAADRHRGLRPPRREPHHARPHGEHGAGRQPAPHWQRPDERRRRPRPQGRGQDRRRCGEPDARRLRPPRHRRGARRCPRHRQHRQAAGRGHAQHRAGAASAMSRWA